MTDTKKKPASLLSVSQTRKAAFAKERCREWSYFNGSPLQNPDNVLENLEIKTK